MKKENDDEMKMKVYCYCLCEGNVWKEDWLKMNNGWVYRVGVNKVEKIECWWKREYDWIEFE